MSEGSIVREAVKKTVKEVFPDFPTSRTYMYYGREEIEDYMWGLAKRLRELGVELPVEIDQTEVN